MVLLQLPSRSWIFSSFTNGKQAGGDLIFVGQRSLRRGQLVDLQRDLRSDNRSGDETPPVLCEHRTVQRPIVTLWDAPRTPGRAETSVGSARHGEWRRGLR